MYHSFNISQQAVIFNEKNELLILKNKDGVWLLPGGRVDDGESDLVKALEREIKEETNLDLVEIIKPVWFDVDEWFKVYATAFICTVKDMSNFEISEEHVEFRWIKKEDAEDFLYYDEIGKKIKTL